MNSEGYSEKLFYFINRTAVIKYVASLIWQLPLLIIFYYISIAFLSENMVIINMFHIPSFQSIAYLLCSIIFYSFGSFMNLHISYMYKFKGSKCNWKIKILTLVSRLFSMIFFNFSLVSYSKEFGLSMLLFVDVNNLLYVTIPVVLVGSFSDTVIFYTNKQYIVEFPSFLDNRYTKRIIGKIPRIIQKTFIISLLPTFLCLLFIKFSFYKYYILYINFFVLYSFWNILLEYMKVVLTSISLFKTIDDVIREDNNNVNDLNVIIESLYQPNGNNIVDSLNGNSMKCNNSSNNNRFNIISDVNLKYNTVYKDYYNIINNNFKNTINQLKEGVNNNNKQLNININNYEKYELSQSFLYKYLSNILINDSSNISQIINSKLLYKLSEVMINSINSLIIKLQICNELLQLKSINNYNIPISLLKIPFGIEIYRLLLSLFLRKNKKIIKDKKLDIITGNLNDENNNNNNNYLNEWFLFPNIRNEVILLNYNNIDEILSIFLRLIQQNQYDIKGYIQITIPTLLESLISLQIELEKYMKEIDCINNDDIKMLSSSKEKEFENLSYCVDLLICEIVSKYYTVLHQFSFSSSCKERIDEYHRRSK